MVPDFRSLHVKSFYSTTGQRILKEVIRPVLEKSASYDRLTGFFSVKSLISVSSGLESLYRANGKMRLVIGVHDIDVDLIAARELGRLLPDDLVAYYKKRFMLELGSLTEVTDKSAIAGIAWMLRLGLLEVKVAAPRNSTGIYHQKRMIFRDPNGNVIAGTGSLNETIGGLYNVEEMQFSFSWRGNEDMTGELVTSFNNIWHGRSEEIDLIGLDDAFASDVLSHLGNPANPLESATHDRTVEQTVLKDVLKLVRTSPSFAPFNLSHAALYPHQERVFAEALSRWPIRVMLADEVGLGKTLEAGIVISYLIRMKIVNNVTILCPAGLMRQWRDEMSRHFNLDFYCFESGRDEFVSLDGIRISGDSKRKVRLKIISAQWARLNEDRFSDNLPDLLLVDEAHAARVNTNPYGTKTTRLWKLLDSIKDTIPHIVLVTATPMQVHPSEYHGLLRLLGLPDQWARFSSYEKSLKVIGEDTQNLALDDSKIVADLLMASLKAFSWTPELLTNRESVLIMELRQADKISKAAPAIKIQQNLREYISILIKVHPGHFLTCRNTKSGLEKFGYRFPKRDFEAPRILMSGLLERYEFAVESYLSDAYGKTEESLKPAGKFPIGFAKSGYYQRLVSSLYASRSSLRKRKDKLAAIEQSLLNSNSELAQKLSISFDIEDEDAQNDLHQDLAIDLPQGRDLKSVISNVKRAITLENSYLDELLGILAKIGDDIEQHDPKFAVALEILEKKSVESSTLVFSRYTDTLEGFVRFFESQRISRSIPGFALYTGSEAWIKTRLGTSEATKVEVTDALNAGTVSIVFCSDAASEGLNLQAAKNLINLDVPWNPARLEQRIGRIARLGQKAAKVHIFNLWYPESIEAKMYTRLLSRQSDYELAVGEAADIFSDAIREEVASRFEGSQPRGVNQFAQLQQVREDFQRKALEKIWRKAENEAPASTLMREDLLDALRYAEKSVENSNYSSVLVSEPGTPNSFTLLHPALDELADSKAPLATDSDFDLCAILSHETLLALCILDKSNNFSLINVMSLGKVVQAILGIIKLKTSDFYATGVDKGALSNKLRRFILDSVNVPNHAFGQVPFGGFVSPHLDIDFEKIEIKKLCKLRLESAS